MSFSFGFDGDDYTIDEDTSLQGPNQTEPQHEEAMPALLPYKRHTLAMLLQAMPRTLAYSTLRLGERQVPRRELWDVKHQLMAGDVDEAAHDRSDSNSDVDEMAPAEETLAYLAKDDVIKGQYEGGFKTWECSLDLAAHLPALQGSYQHVVELGCGTALPSMCVLDAALETRMALQLTIQDYNLAVLQLCTIPNLFLVWRRRQQLQMNTEAWQEEGEVIVTGEDLSHFQQTLVDMGITIEGLTGAWSTEMASGLVSSASTLLLASETIYAPSSLPAFLSLTEQVLQSRGSLAMVAAKHVYFGVGGGIRAFTAGCHERGLACKHVFEHGSGVRRSVLAVSQTQPSVA